MKKLVISAVVAAFGAAVVLPIPAIIGSDGAFAAQKTAAKTVKKKKPAKMYRKPAKKPATSM